ncbi:hypothetical protein EG68_12599, partial [Paragonimus skrjabini miyazakii]
NNIVFNLIAFNSTITEWQAIGPTVADETACHDAIAWIDQLEAVGGTATEVAIFRARHHLDAVDPHTGLCSGQRNPAWMQNCSNKTGIFNMITKAIYLLTDGKPDSSCTSILKTVSDAWKIDPSSIDENSRRSAKDKTTKLRRNAQNYSKDFPIHTISPPLSE